MQMIKEGNSKLKDWSLIVKCTGNGIGIKWYSTHYPCYLTQFLEAGDIVKRAIYDVMYDDNTVPFRYGFICPNCHCFTEVDERLIPQEIKDHCLQIAGIGTHFYEDLTNEEKNLSLLL